MSTLKVNNVQDLGADAVVTNGVVAKGALPSGSVLQVVSTTKTDGFTMASTTFADVTGLSASITPTSATSKILVQAMITGGGVTGSVAIQAKLLRGSTDIAVGDAAGSRTRAATAAVDGNNDIAPMQILFLDSPNTTSNTTYKIQVRANNSGNTVSVNRSVLDQDLASVPRTVSTITLMEIAG